MFAILVCDLWQRWILFIRSFVFYFPHGLWRHVMKVFCAQPFLASPHFEHFGSKRSCSERQSNLGMSEDITDHQLTVPSNAKSQHSWGVGWGEAGVVFNSSLIPFGNLGHLTWVRLQQPQEQHCPFVPVRAVVLCVQTMVWLPVFGICNLHTAADACDDAQGLYEHYY